MFNGLRRALASIKASAIKLIGSKGTATSAPPELDVIPGKRRSRQKAAEPGLPREYGQRFPIRAAARRRAIATLDAKVWFGPHHKVRIALDPLEQKLEKEMRDAWEKRVDDGILKRAENEVRAAKVAFAREHGISRKAARRILNEMRRAGVHVVKIAAGSELERELVLGKAA